MALLATSDLVEAGTLQSTDLINISQDQGGSVYDSKKITAGNFDMVAGQRNYGAQGSDPSSPTPVNGDIYYNTVLSQMMCYDGSRSKWLSIETSTIYFGRNGGTLAGVYYRGIDGMAFSSLWGFIAPYNGTVIGIGYTRSGTNAATFEVTADGVATGAELASSSSSGKSIVLNSNFSADAILGIRNKAASDTTYEVQGWVRIKWRA